MTNLATQRTTDVVVAHYINNVRLSSPNLPTLSAMLAVGAGRSHYVPENAIGRIFWSEVEREARGRISAAIKNDPELAGNLTQIRAWKIA
jgi:hypothetical protein